MAGKSREKIQEEYYELVKPVVQDDACEWVKSLLDANGSKYSEVSPATILGQENTELSWEEFEEVQKNPMFRMVTGMADFYKVAVDIWSGCPLKVDTVYVYGKISGASWQIYRDQILDAEGNKLVWCTEDEESNKVWHGVEDFRFWNVPPYVERAASAMRTCWT